MIFKNKRAYEAIPADLNGELEDFGYLLMILAKGVG